MSREPHKREELHLTVSQRLLADTGLVDYAPQPPILTGGYHMHLRRFDCENSHRNEAAMIETLEHLASGVLLQKSRYDPEGTEKQRWQRRLEGDMRLYKFDDTSGETVTAIVGKIEEMAMKQPHFAEPARGHVGAVLKGRPSALQV